MGVRRLYRCFFCGLILTVAATLFLLSACAVNQGPPAIDYAAPQLGILFDETLTVVDVDQSSVAETAGVQKGDILISFEDIPFATEKQKAKELIWSSAAEPILRHYSNTGKWNGKTFRLRIERNAETIELQITPMPPFWWGNAPTPTAAPTTLDYI